MIVDALATVAAEGPQQAPDDGETGGGVGRAPALGDSFAEQWEYVTSTATFNAVCCSRRAGKTRGAVMRALWVAARARPGSWIHFGSLIRRNARKHFWRPFCEMLKALGWGFRANGTEMIAELANGVFVQAFGCDDEAGTKAVQGDNSVLFMIDECHLPNNDVLEKLVDVATPMLTDFGGMLDLLGLPPEAEPSFFSEALDSQGWAHFGWDMFCHDFPDPREVKRARVQAIIDKRGLTWDHPIIKRQYRGLRERDPGKVAYEYARGRNDYDPDTVNFDQGRWQHSAGLDLASGELDQGQEMDEKKSDKDSIVVHAWPLDVGEADRVAYSRFAWQFAHLHVDDLALVVQLVHVVYRPQWVGDTGGHGAVKVLNTLSARLRARFAPKPPNVMVSVRFVNDDYRTGRLKHPTKDTETPRLLAAVETMPWTEEQKTRARELLTEASIDLTGEIGRVAKTVNPRTRKVEINKAGIHSDCSEANRYAHHGNRHWAARPKKPDPYDVPEGETRDQRREREEKMRAKARRKRFPWNWRAA